MTDHEPPPRPRPSRPDVQVTPMREPIPDERPRAVDAATVIWGVALLVLAGTAALIGLRQQDIRESLTASLIVDRPDTAPDDITQTVDITLIASGAAALILLLVALMGLVQVRGRTAGGRSVLTIAGVLVAAGAIAFWIAVGDAVDGFARWSPLAVAALAVVGTGLLFVPVVGVWLTGKRS